MIDVDKLAQEIRRVDGNHDKGAGALAEALMPFLTAALSHADHGGVKALEWETKLRRSSEDRQPCTIRPSEADAIISELRQLRRTLDVGQRTSHARKLAFEAALTQAPAPTLTGEVETLAPVSNIAGEQVDYPKILYVCETCWAGNNEACGNDRDRINVTPDGRWLCEDCRDGEGIDVALCRDAPKLYTEPSSHLRAACEGIADDYMTSEHHHPGYVLIPTAKLEEIRAALTTTEEPRT